MSPEDQFLNADNQKIFIRESVVENAKANVFLIHGLHEYSYYLVDFMAELNRIKCNTFAMDLMGHGKSEGPRAAASSIDIFLRDILQFVNLKKEGHPACPNILFGYSMGGLICTKLMLDHPAEFDGLITLGIAFNAKWNPFQSIPLKPLSYFLPNIGVRKFNASELTHDKEFLERKEKDDLVVHSPVKSCIANAIFNGMDSVRSRISDLKAPILIIHGQEDRVCPPSGSEFIHQYSSSTDKSLILVPGAYHAVHHEDKDKIEIFYDAVKKWLKNRFDCSDD